MIKWIGAFFCSDTNNSSKRLVGILGALSLYTALLKNPTDALVWATFSLSAVALGLTTIELLNELFKRIKEK